MWDYKETRKTDSARNHDASSGVGQSFFIKMIVTPMLDGAQRSDVGTDSLVLGVRRRI